MRTQYSQACSFFNLQTPKDYAHILILNVGQGFLECGLFSNFRVNHTCKRRCVPHPAHNSLHVFISVSHFFASHFISLYHFIEEIYDEWKFYCEHANLANSWSDIKLMWR